MALFFSLTTPVGVAIGIGISSAYNENSPRALITEGILTAAAAGILNYMALVDLLAEDFMNPRVQNNGKLQVILSVSLLLGTGLMSMLAIWAWTLDRQGRGSLDFPLDILLLGKYLLLHYLSLVFLFFHERLICYLYCLCKYAIIMQYIYSMSLYVIKFRAEL